MHEIKISDEDFDSLCKLGCINVDGKINRTICSPSIYFVKISDVARNVAEKAVWLGNPEVLPATGLQIIRSRIIVLHYPAREILAAQEILAEAKKTGMCMLPHTPGDDNPEWYFEVVE